MHEKWWRYALCEAPSLDAMARVLRQLADDKLAILLRDEPKSAELVKGPTIQRVSSNFDDVPRAWLMIDVDDLVAPHLDVVDEPELAAHFIRDELATYAPELEGVAMFIAWSGSCGIRDRSTLKAHVVIMLDTQKTSGELRRWALAINARAGFRLVDKSLYHRVHIHYTARPICTGFPDPFPGDRRFVMLSGASTATLEVPPRDALRVVRTASGAQPGELRGFDSRLARIGVDGINVETMAAIGAAVRHLGPDRAEASRTMILAKIEARIRQTREPARAAEHLAKLNGMFDRVVDRQRMHEVAAFPVVPTYPDAAVPVDEAESAAEATIGEFFSRIGEGADAPLMALACSTGVGKTEQFLQGARRVQSQHRGALLVQRHKLTDEVLDRAKQKEINAASWRGREALNPGATDGSRMCIEPAIHKAAQRVELVDAACGACPSREMCPYISQRVRPKADLEIAANNFLTRRPPAAIVQAGETATRTVDYLVVDEGFTDRMADAPRVLPFEELAMPPVGLGPARAADLDVKRAPVRRALRAAWEDGNLLMRHLQTEGIDTSFCQEWEDAEWLARPRVELKSGSADEVVSQLDALDGRFDSRPAMLARAIRQYIDADATEFGRALSLAIRKVTGPAQYSFPKAGAIDFLRADTDPGAAPSIRFRVRRDVHHAWNDVPILLMDATSLPEDVTLGRIFGREVKRTEVMARMPDAVHVEQLLDALPNSTLHDDGHAKEKLRSIADRIEIIVRRRRGQGRDGCDVVVISTRKVECALRELLADRRIDVAPSVRPHRLHSLELRHYGDLAGEDRYRGVRAIVLISWPLPPSADLEREVGAATGLMPRVLPGRGWAMVDGALRMRDGTGRRVTRPLHVDPQVEAARWRKTEGEMLQALGRARWSRRTETSPLDVLMLSPVPLPGIVVDRAIRWTDVDVSRLELAFWRLGGVLPLRPDDLVRTGLWPSEDAAARYVDRKRSDIASKIELIKDVSVLSARYRHPGQRAWSKALFNPDLSTAHLIELLRTATGEPDLFVESARDR